MYLRVMMLADLFDISISVSQQYCIRTLSMPASDNDYYFSSMRVASSTAMHPFPIGLTRQVLTPSVQSSIRSRGTSSC